MAEKKNIKRLCAVSQGVQMEWISLLRTCGKMDKIYAHKDNNRKACHWRLALLTNRIGGMHESKEKRSLSNSIYENWEIIHLSSRFMPRSHFERAFITQSTLTQKNMQTKRNILFRFTNFWIFMPIIQKNRLIVLVGTGFWDRDLQYEEGSRKLFPLRFCILPGKLLFN